MAAFAAVSLLVSGCEDIDSDEFMGDLYNGLQAANAAYDASGGGYATPSYGPSSDDQVAQALGNALAQGIREANGDTGGSYSSPPMNFASAGQTTTAGAGGGRGAVMPGSYPTRPNLAEGAACSGFTEQNYRSLALSGGGDQQLYTMCGQAFEYYTMYKRAIAQGYSEADANRTYAAHAQSAQVANQFYADTH